MASTQSDSQFALLGRVLWMMFAPAGLFVTSAAVLTSPGNGWWTTASVLYLVALAATLAGRWLESARGVPLDSRGAPITSNFLVRWTLIVLTCGLAWWLLMNVISNFVLR